MRYGYFISLERSSFTGSLIIHKSFKSIMTKEEALKKIMDSEQTSKMEMDEWVATAMLAWGLPKESAIAIWQGNQARKLYNNPEDGLIFIV